MQVQSPQKKAGGLDKMLQLGQVGLGLYTGGLSGMLMATSGTKNIIDSNKNQAQGLEPSAMDRRLDTQMSDMDQAKAFHEVDSFMPELPEDLRQEIGPPMYTAMAKLSAKMKAEMTGRQG